MAFLSIEESFEAYKSFETEVQSSQSEVSQKIYVTIFKSKVAAGGLINSVRKQPIIVFSLPDGKELPKRRWTKEMKILAKDYANEFPVPDPHKTFTLFGKIFFAIVILGILVGSGMLIYHMAFGAS